MYFVYLYPLSVSIVFHALRMKGNIFTSNKK